MVSLPSKTSRYWFKPRRFGLFNGYYPVTWEGWALTVVCLFLLTYVFETADQQSNSGRNTLFNFAPGAVAVILLFDMMRLRTSKYPGLRKLGRVAVGKNYLL